MDRAHVQSPSVTDRRRDYVSYAILALIPTFLFIDVLAGSKVFYLRDVLAYYHPAKQVLRNIVLNGEFPYWNPWFSAGQPLAANPEHEVFYPLTWLILLPSYNFGFHLLAVVHLHIASFSMYALLRAKKLGRPAAVFGGLSYGLGGVAASMLNLWPYLLNLAWLPLTCLYTRQFLHTRSRRSFGLAAFFLGLQLIIGEPVTAFLTGLILGLYALAHGWRQGGIAWSMRRVGDIALISITALLVSAVQTLPAFDHFRDSVRVRGLEWDLVRPWSMPWIRVTEIFYPHVLGYAVPDDGLAYWGDRFYGAKDTPFVLSIYAGLAVAVFAAAGIVARVRGAALFAGIAIVSLTLAAGENTPLLRLLYEAHLAQSFRYPEKFTIMIGFAIVVFASVVLDRLLAGDERVRRAALQVTGVTIVIAAIAAVVSFTPLSLEVFAHIWRPTGGVNEQMLRLSAQTWITELARGVFLMIILRNVTRMGRAAWLTLFALFVLLDLAPIVTETAPRLDRSFYDAPAVVRQLPVQRHDYRLFHYAQWSKNRKSQYVQTHPDVFWVVRNTLPPMVPADYGVRTVFEGDFDLTALLPTTDFTRSILDLAEAKDTDWLNMATSMSNVEYVVVYENPRVAFAKTQGIRRDLQPVKVIKGRHNPRYYFASRLVPIRDRHEFVSLNLKDRFPRDVAFVNGPSFEPARGVVHSYRETANTAEIDVEAEGRSFLVMSVTPHKYWRITVDGREVAPVVTNVGYQGIEMPAGRHRVKMQYRNPLIATGGAISVATLLFLGLAGWRRPAAGTMRPL